MPTQILNEMYSLYEAIKTSEDLIDFLEKAKPLYLKGLELCDKLSKVSPNITLEDKVKIGEPLRVRTLISIIDQDLNIVDGLCELRYKTKPHCKLDYWKETLKEAMLPKNALFYKGHLGVYPDSKVPVMRTSFNLRIDLIDKMLVIAKAKYHE